MKIKTWFTFSFTLLLFSYANTASVVYVYDANGKEIAQVDTSFEAISTKMSELLSSSGKTNLFISKSKVFKQSTRAHIKESTSKQVGNYRYIETARNQITKVCPTAKTNAAGYWVSELSSHIDKENCILFDGISNTRGVLVLFVNYNSGVVDTNWILVDQRIVELTKGSHKIWNGDSIDLDLNAKPLHSEYKDTIANFDVIVDASEFTEGDAIWLRNSPDSSIYAKPFFDSKLSLQGDKDFPLLNAHLFWNYANMRSLKDGLKPVYRDISNYSEEIKKYPILFRGETTSFVVDTSANGYRLPFDKEWYLIQRGGTSTKFYWGDAWDSQTVSRYEWNLGTQNVKRTKQLLPNPYGLYDVYGNARESVMIMDKNTISMSIECAELNVVLSHACMLAAQLDRKRILHNSQLKKIAEDKVVPFHTFGVTNTLSDNDFVAVEPVVRSSPLGFRLIRKIQ